MNHKKNMKIREQCNNNKKKNSVWDYLPMHCHVKLIRFLIIKDVPFPNSKYYIIKQPFKKIALQHSFIPLNRATLHDVI